MKITSWLGDLKLMKYYRVLTLSQLSKVANWVLEQSEIANPSLTLCWASHHKADVDYVKTMLQKRLSNITVAEDDSGNIKAILYFEFRDEQNKVSEKWVTFASVVIDKDVWANMDFAVFKELLRFSYNLCYSQGVFKGEFWVLEKIFKCHQELFGDKFLTVLDQQDAPPWGKVVRFLIDVKGAVEAAKT